jgi:hypothetical protein
LACSANFSTPYVSLLRAWLLGPDEGAFKEAVDGDPANGWRLSVLDLATMAVTPLAEPGSVDDQAAWLDDGTVAYTLRQPDGRPDIWSVPADGTGTPRLLMPQADSPAPLSAPQTR